MIPSLLRTLRRFWAGEDGNSTIPYVLWVPAFIIIIVSSIELGTVTIRSVQLERALDQAVREVKIGVGAPSHDALKAAICAKTSVLAGCKQTLQLEMIPLDMRNYSAPPSKADCVDVSQEATPQRTYRNGSGGQLMILRACYKFKPLTGAATLNASLRKDAQGYTAIVSTSAFVYEPS